MQDQKIIISKGVPIFPDDFGGQSPQMTITFDKAYDKRMIFRRVHRALGKRLKGFKFVEDKEQ